MELYKNNTLLINHNTKLNGIEIKYLEEMTDLQMETIKKEGFRWSRNNQVWYKKWDGDENASVKQFVNKLIEDGNKIQKKESQMTFNEKEENSFSNDFVDNEKPSDLKKTNTLRQGIDFLVENTRKKNENKQQKEDISHSDVFSFSEHEKIEKPLGAKTIKELRQEIKSLIEVKNNREFTLDEKKLISLYEGGGGLKEKNATSAEILNAFYTPHNIIKKTWELVDAYNPTAKTVLEPASGIGRFAENRNKNVFTLHELDPVASKIAKILHPEATVIEGAFQSQFFDENGIARRKDYTQPEYDVVIGNPPYGIYSGEWKGKGEGQEFQYIEEYFLAKGIEATKQEGILAFIMPSGFLKRNNEKTARIITQKALLLEAWRLPNGAFPTTDIGTDIVIFKKLSNKDLNLTTEEERMSLLLKDSYFTKNPNHILGEKKLRSGQFGEVEYIALPENQTIDEALTKIKPNINFIPEIKKDSIKNRKEDTLQNINNSSFIERAFEKIKSKSNIIPLSENDLFKKEFEIEDLKNNFDKIRREFWRDNWHPASFLHTFFDTTTKTAVVTVQGDRTNKKFLIASMDEKGIIHKHFDHESYKKLTPRRKQIIEDLFDRYTKLERDNDHINKNNYDFINMQNLYNNFLGINENNAYFKDVIDIELIDRVTFFNSSENKKVEIKKNIFSYNTAITIERLASIKTSENDIFYPIINNLYLKDTTLKQIIDDDIKIKSLINVTFPEVQSYNEFRREGHNNYSYWYNETQKAEEQIKELQKQVNNVFASINNKSIDEIIEYSKEKSMIVRNERQKQIEYNTKEVEKNNAQNKILSCIFEKGFSLQDEFYADNAIVKYEKDKENEETINVFIDSSLSFAVNTKEQTVVTFNNFRVTEDFIKKIDNFFENNLTVYDKKYTNEVFQLNTILNQKSVIKLNQKKGEDIAQICINNYIRTNTLPVSSNENLKKNLNLSFNVPVFSFQYLDKDILLKMNGTNIQAFQGLKSNSPLFQFDKKSNTLHLYQDSYENGYIQAFEKIFKDNFSQMQIIKDVTINNQRYIDTNGITIKTLPQKKKYEPTIKEVMNNKEFANKYGAAWNPKDRVFWEATDFKGYINLSNLSEKEKTELHNSENYIQELENVFIHKELYASGNIYKKIEQNEKNFKENLITHEMFSINNKVLEQALPKKIELTEINQSILSPFIENFELNNIPIKEKFLQWATGYNLEESLNMRDYIVDFTTTNISRDDIPPTISWSDIVDYIDKTPLGRITDKSLNTVEQNEIRNQKLNDRKNTAEMLFNRYLQQGLTKEEKFLFVDKYNRTFNANKAADYSKLPLFVDGMNSYRKGKQFVLYDQQIKGISFLSNKGNGLLAYDVGVGKTAAGIVATVNQLQSGRALRPLIVVPKSVIGKWESDIHELFPDIIVNNLGNLSIKQNKETALFYDGDHGLIIPPKTITLVTKEALNNIAWQKTTIDTDLYDDYADMLGLTEKIESDNPRDRALASESIYKSAGCASQVNNDNYILWEKTGFDHITVDEAHAYKNLFKVPRPKKGETNEFLAMGQGKPSKRALKMFNITQLIQKENDDRNVFMLTATPFTNSALEVYSMLTYIARKELEENKIKNLYDFCKQYAKTRFEQVITEKGDVAYKSVMKEFGDLQGLQNIITQYMDKVDGEEAGICRPIKKTHAIHLNPTSTQKEMFDYAVNVIMECNEKDLENAAPTLEGMSILRTAALSPALIKKEKLDKWAAITHTLHGIVIPPIEEVVDCSPKLKLVCDTIIENWKKHKNAGQVIYMPEGTDAFPHIINYMIKQGIPQNVFASIDGSSAKIANKNVTITKDDETDDVRAKVAEAFNDKKNPCKILIGSSAISEGMDLNGNTIALYNCMLGWNPTEPIQVEGRIWRQGNEQGHVHIVYPLINDSIDSLLYQKHDEKSSRISNLWSFKGNTLNVESINPESMKYELIKDPVKRAKIEIQQQVEELKNKILMLDNQLKDYDQLETNKVKFKEKLEQRKKSKEEYINNYKESIRNGQANRTEEAQQIGIERHNKAINDFEKQLDNIERKYLSMGINKENDKKEFSEKILIKRAALIDKNEKIISPENVRLVVEKYKTLLNKESQEAKKRETNKSLHNNIINDLKPMEIVEFNIKSERYEKAINEASQNNNIKEKERLKKEYEEYIAAYNKKWNSNNSDNINIPQKNINKTEEVEQKETISNLDSNGYDIVKTIITIAPDYILNEGQINISLFEEENKSPRQNIIDEKINLFSNKTLFINFADRLHDSLKGVEHSEKTVLYTAKKLIETMPPEEQNKLKKAGIDAGVKNKTDAVLFYQKIAKTKQILQIKNKSISENVNYNLY